MKREGNTIIFDKTEEIEEIQDVCEIFIDISKCVGEEHLRNSAKKLSAFLEEMRLNQ